MAKRPTTTPNQEGIEFRPDGWERFKAAVHAAAHPPRGRKGSSPLAKPLLPSVPTGNAAQRRLAERRRQE